MRSKGAEYLTKPGQRLLVNVVGPMAQAVQNFVESSRGRRGPKPLCLKYLEMFQADVVAFMAMRCLVDGMSHSHRTLVSVALDIGGRLRDEARFRTFEDEQPLLYKVVQDNLKKHPKGKNPMVRRSMLSHTIVKNKLTLVDWPKADRLHLGVTLIEMAVASTGLFIIDKAFRGNKEYTMVKPTPRLLDWIRECDARLELMSPLRKPMVCPPNDWTNPHDGGYLTGRLRTKLVQGRGAGFLRELEVAEMPAVYTAINALQRTPWAINQPMLTLLEELAESGITVEGWPSHYAIPPVPRADNWGAMTKEQRQSWKMRAAEAYRQEERRASLLIQAASVVAIARELKDEPAIYFPHYLDFRGRMYPLPQALNPQGTDLSKSLLTFAEGKPLGKSGMRWLKIHLANCFGIDKCSLDERVQWTEENSDQIISSANDPLDNRWWTEADKPFQFLAASIEWILAVEEGEDYVCHLPIMVDGSNNGLQHLSALLRDESCGRLVNLMPADKPADVYQSVADGVMASLRLHLSDSGSIPTEEAKHQTACKWLEYGIDRALLKRPVMILPYGGSVAAMRKYMVEHVLNNAEKSNPFATDFGRAVNFLAASAWQVMDGLLVGPRQAMDWMRKAGREFVRSNGQHCIPITWTTPTGFVVQQRYLDVKHRRVKTKLGDQLVYLSLVENTDRVDGRKTATALSPNFVHSLDASALALTVGRCQRLGITSFSAVHDSYGTWAADMNTLFCQLREAFVEMYQTDRLELLRQEIQKGLEPGKVLDDPPAPGSLDLNGVLSSEFFFA